MTETEIAYLAGFIDGEGCISSNDTTWLFVDVCNTDRAVLDWIQEHFDGKIYQNQGNKHTKRTCWMWRTHTHKCKQLLVAILPYLKVKKAQAEIGLALIEHHEGKTQYHSDAKFHVVKLRLQEALRAQKGLV